MKIKASKGLIVSSAVTFVLCVLGISGLEAWARLRGTEDQGRLIFNNGLAFTKEEQKEIEDGIKRCKLLSSPEPRYSKLYFFSTSYPVGCKDFSAEEVGDIKIRSTVDSRGIKYSRLYSSGERYIIWMFGGSALFSTYAQDKDTIPSLLSQRLEGGKLRVLIRNFGTSGTDSEYEFVNMVSALGRTKERPDLVVFYTGGNDSLATPSFKGDHIGLRYDLGASRRGLNKGLYRAHVINELLGDLSAFYKMSLYSKIKYGLILPALKGPDPEVNFELSGYRFCRTMLNADSILESHGINRLYLLAPMRHTIQERMDTKSIESLSTNEKGSRRAYKVMRKCMSTNNRFYDLSMHNSIPNVDLFYDDGHLGPSGNRAIATDVYEIIKQIKPRLSD